MPIYNLRFIYSRCLRIYGAEGVSSLHTLFTYMLTARRGDKASYFRRAFAYELRYLAAALCRCS